MVGTLLTRTLLAALDTRAHTHTRRSVQYQRKRLEKRGGGSAYRRMVRSSATHTAQAKKRSQRQSMGQDSADMLLPALPPLL